MRRILWGLLEPEEQPPLTLRPPARLWPRLIRRRDLAPESRALRGELGLATEGPVLMSGHQAAIWHAGILAKWFALGALGERGLGATAWVVVDQDDNDGTVVEYPALVQGRLTRARWRLDEAGVMPEAVAMASRPAVGGAAAPREPAPATAEVEAGLRRIGAALVGEFESAAAQIAEAARRMATALGPGPRSMILATALARTREFAELVERMKREPGACIATYNAAASARGLARVRGLAAERGELPLWRLRRGEPRRAVFVGQIGEVPAEELAPRGLLMTGMLRAWACDLFVHGLGGGVYDAVTEEWFRSWLGAELAPVVVASATRRLPLGVGAPTEEAIRAAAWRAHRARHDPALIGDREAGERKRAMVEEIARSRGGARAALFRRMHEMLAGARAAHAPELARLETEAAGLRARREEAAVAGDRAWPFALHEARAMRALAREIEAEIGGKA